MLPFYLNYPNQAPDSTPITSLTIRGEDFIKDFSSVIEILQLTPSLKSLGLSYCSLTNSQLKALSSVLPHSLVDLRLRAKKRDHVNPEANTDLVADDGLQVLASTLQNLTAFENVELFNFPIKEEWFSKLPSSTQ